MDGLRPFLVWLLLALASPALHAQQWVEVKGTVYDNSQRSPLEGVSVMSTSGRGTITDVMGHYRLVVASTDSIFFSYQNRATAKHPVATMPDPQSFNMALGVSSPNPLPPVTIYGRSYKLDSLQNRQEYAKYFNWQRPNPLRNVNVANGGVGMDPNDIINLFRFRRNRQLASLQARLVKEEQDKYVDYRFNKAFVKKVTGLLSDQSVKRFMYKYRPPYDFVAIVNDLELGYYIQQCYKKERGLLPPGVDIYLLGVDPLEKEIGRE
ncbi:MAG: carboxypeptidase-like regulatory domain-containing protein [Chitinophagaceae bacterium]|jgi:hypothetical protein|nr:carboxypeptidase-like regulatory domain-containing protein [Chitinophagaceae bacterium]